jgi:hypothetical protein
MWLYHLAIVIQVGLAALWLGLGIVPILLIVALTIIILAQ